jgi:hypothetical protein
LSTSSAADGSIATQATPEETVASLSKYIVGQEDAKKAVAIALRSRWRRLQLPAEMQAEITPFNILMAGPTGTGKTEIARRLAAISGSPFIKVEATKYTEVGIFGQNSDSMIKDLVEVAIDLERSKAMDTQREWAHSKALDAIVTELCGIEDQHDGGESQSILPDDGTAELRAMIRAQVESGKLDERMVDIKVDPVVPPADRYDRCTRTHEPTNTNARSARSEEKGSDPSVDCIAVRFAVLLARRHLGGDEGMPPALEEMMKNLSSMMQVELYPSALGLLHLVHSTHLLAIPSSSSCDALLLRPSLAPSSAVQSNPNLGGKQGGGPGGGGAPAEPTQRMPVKEALKVLTEQEAAGSVDNDAVLQRALEVGGWVGGRAGG